MTHHILLPSLWSRAFWIVFAINFVWQNLNEVLRYLAFLSSLVRAAVPSMPNAPGMNFGIFMIGELWDAVLVLIVTTFIWIALEYFGTGVKNALLAATAVWAACLLLPWVGIWNLGLTSFFNLALTLPLTWLEIAVSGLIINWGMRRFA